MSRRGSGAAATVFAAALLLASGNSSPALHVPHENETATWRSLWDYNDPVASEQRFRAAAAEAAEPAARLEIRTQVARSLGLQRRFDEAFAELDAVESSAAGAGSRVATLLLLERGRAHRSSGDVDSARPLFRAAFDLAAPAGHDFLAVDAAHMLGIVEPAEAGLEWNDRAIALASASNDPAARGWAAAIANNQGWNYFDLGRHAEALQRLEQALALRRERPEAIQEIRIARWCVARLQRSLGRNEIALAEQRALLAEYEAAGEPSGYVHEELGELLHLSGEREAARAHFAAAHAILAQDQWLVANEAARLARLAELAR